MVFQKGGNMATITLKAARVNAGLTQADAAKQLGVSVQTLCNYEKGKKSPTVLVAKKMSELYDATISELFG